MKKIKNKLFELKYIKLQSHKYWYYNPNWLNYIGHSKFFKYRIIDRDCFGFKLEII